MVSYLTAESFVDSLEKMLCKMLKDWCLVAGTLGTVMLSKVVAVGSAELKVVGRGNSYMLLQGFVVEVQLEVDLLGKEVELAVVEALVESHQTSSGIVTIQPNRAGSTLAFLSTGLTFLGAVPEDHAYHAVGLH